MKKFLIILASVIGFGFSVNAQSTIYLMYDVKFWTQKIPFKVNGQDAFVLIGEPKGGVYGASLYTPSKKKCTLYQEGKVILSTEFSATIPTNGKVIPYSGEIQLNLSENSVHYIKIKPVFKGNTIVFEELDEKVGEKEFAKKKYANNLDYVEVMK